MRCGYQPHPSTPHILAGCLSQLLQHALHALLKLPGHEGAGHEHAHVQGNDGAILEVGWSVGQIKSGWSVGWLVGWSVGGHCLHRVQTYRSISALHFISLHLYPHTLSTSGTSPAAILSASPSMSAVFPTPGSPRMTGLFFVLRERMLITLSRYG